MTSFFPSFGSTPTLSATAGQSDDPHLEITVVPSASAFYAGETFSATITFRNTRTPAIYGIANTRSAEAGPSTPTASTTNVIETGKSIPRLYRRKQIGLAIQPAPQEVSIDRENAEAGPSRTAMNGTSFSPNPLYVEAGYPYSPGANPTSRAGWPRSPERGVLPNYRSPDVVKQGYGDIGRGGSKSHERRTRSLALGKGTLSPQEMVWALGGQQGPPPLPSRRPHTSAHIPAAHPHSRKISIGSNIASPPPETSALTSISSELDSIAEGANVNTRPSFIGLGRPSSRTTLSSSSINSSSSTSRSHSRLQLTEEEVDGGDDSEPKTPRVRNKIPRDPITHSRTPSYHNAYGANFVNLPITARRPPPQHPSVRSQEPRGITTVLWAHTRLVAHFHPTNAYIPPDPLLPLRSLLLHQPVGSGSQMTPSGTTGSASTSSGLTSSSSRWHLNFGTGTIGTSTQPSLTGSLFGLAKGLVVGGGGGSLEEERKRVWNMKDLPVLETMRSLIGVDIKLKEGESREFTYTFQLPTILPPAHRGKAFRFSYDLILSLNVALPGPGKRQKSKEISIPIRVWSHVSVSDPMRVYDVLDPVIQTKEEAKVDEQTSPTPADEAVSLQRQPSGTEGARLRGGDTQESLQAYAKHLIETLIQADVNGGQPSPRVVPNSPSMKPRSRGLSPVGTPGSSLSIAQSPTPSRSTEKLEIPGGETANGVPLRAGTLSNGDDGLFDEMEEGRCGEAVEILSRHSMKASYDISKEGDLVAVLTLIKTTYRLGESVLGVVTFNTTAAQRRVLKFSAFLESHELIPENLLPPSSTPGPPKQPPLAKLEAEYRSAYVLHTSRLSFSLDIPSDATPAFSLAAGKEGLYGGLEWRVRLAFLVAAPGRKHKRHNHTSQPVHLIPTPASGTDGDNRFYTAAGGIAPLIPYARLDDDGNTRTTWEEMECETVECEVPVRVLAGNTAFLVKPSVYTV